MCKVVGKKRFAASEKRKAIRWLGARCVTGSEQAVGAVGAVTASEQSTTEAMEVEVVGTVAMAMSKCAFVGPSECRGRALYGAWAEIEACAGACALWAYKDFLNQRKS